MFEKSAKQRIIEKLKEAGSRGVIPTELHIPKDVELEMCLLERSEVGDSLFGEITRYGPREAITRAGSTLYGMTVHWDASDLLVK